MQHAKLPHHLLELAQVVIQAPRRAVHRARRRLPHRPAGAADGAAAAVVALVQRPPVLSVHYDRLMRRWLPAPPGWLSTLWCCFFCLPVREKNSSCRAVCAALAYVSRTRAPPGKNRASSSDEQTTTTAQLKQ